MSASAITDALIDNLSAASVIGACQVGTHWAILETTSGCCAVINFSVLESNRWAMNNQHERLYTHEITYFVKDTSGNAKIIERQTQGLIDTSVCSLESDPTLQGAENIRELGQITVSHDPKTVAEMGGATWYMAEMSVNTKEWPDN